MKKATPKPEKAWRLHKLTCAELADLIEQPLDGLKPIRKNDALRERYNHPGQLSRLKLCGGLKASSHIELVKTATLFLKVPTLVLTCTGGKPKADSMPPFSVSLKRIGAENGIVIHRCEKGAFILAKNPPRPDPAPVTLCDKSFELAP